MSNSILFWNVEAGNFDICLALNVTIVAKQSNDGDGLKINFNKKEKKRKETKKVVLTFITRMSAFAAYNFQLSFFKTRKKLSLFSWTVTINLTKQSALKHVWLRSDTKNAICTEVAEVLVKNICSRSFCKKNMLDT